MTFGEKIKNARKAAGMTRDTLAEHLGLSPAAVSKIENDDLKFGVRDETVIKIADALGDRSILTYALMHNPICQLIIPRAFTPLNNTKSDPSASLTKFREEIGEADEAAKILERIFAHSDPTVTPMFKETLLANLEQIIDVTRTVEELFAKLKFTGVLSEEEHLEIFIRQQAKCERNGHHRRKED